MGTHRNRRRLNAVLGAFLLAVAGAGAVVLRAELLSRPVLALQFGLTGLAGLCNLVAATDRLSAGQWYQWSGLGNVFLGVSLPLGVTGGPVLFGVFASVGGLSLAAIGLDMLLFHGRYMHQEGFDSDPG